MNPLKNINVAKKTVGLLMTGIFIAFCTAPVRCAEVPVATKAASSPARQTSVQKRVLIVTGLEYHQWKKTTPILQAAITRDPRLSVTVTEDAKFLASPDLKNYDVILLHYMNWKQPGPGSEAQEGLRKAVEAGTGLVMIHFACGAFQEWPGFVKVAGRVWNPKFRPHDARRQFTVEILDKSHPVTAGMENFQTTDELYTCLDGTEPIQVLAQAVSMNKNIYPMVFTHPYGKGRVLQCVLGHDEKALAPEPVQKIFRRACAWAAGLDPSE